MTLDKAIPTKTDKLQLFLLDFEEALFKRCPKCRGLIKQNWSPNMWTAKLERLIEEIGR